jgi:hypothetical protein
MGVKEVAGRKVNFYGSVGGSKNGTGKTVKLGVQNLEGRCSSDNRLKIDDASVRNFRDLECAMGE